jgi:DNA-binding response OmpR family regulator
LHLECAWELRYEGIPLGGRPSHLIWMLPGMSGVEVCCPARDAGSAAAIVMLTARDEVEDRVRGLDSGADDYVVKPFSIAELLARVRSVARRTSSQRCAIYQKAAQCSSHTASPAVGWW